MNWLLAVIRVQHRQILRLMNLRNLWIMIIISFWSIFIFLNLLVDLFYRYHSIVWIFNIRLFILISPLYMSIWRNKIKIIRILRTFRAYHLNLFVLRSNLLIPINSLTFHSTLLFILTINMLIFIQWIKLLILISRNQLNTRILRLWIRKPLSFSTKLSNFIHILFHFTFLYIILLVYFLYPIARIVIFYWMMGRIK